MPEIVDYSDFPPPPADFPPPPSPVSSSYSELRRATHSNTLPDYGTYAPSSQVCYIYFLVVYFSYPVGRIWNSDYNRGL